MNKFIFTILCAGSLLVGCQKKEPIVTKIDKIIGIQNAFRNQPSKSSYSNLHKAEVILEQIQGAPDSLKAENNYLKGLFLQGLKRTDSAEIYFYIATEFVIDSIETAREITYFKTAFESYLSQEKYGDCLVLLNLMLEKTSKMNHKLVAWIYSNKVWVYKQMKDYQKALQINAKQESFAKQKDQKNLPVVLISKADIYYRQKTDKQKAFQILDSLSEIDSLSANYKRQIFGNYGVYMFYEGNYTQAFQYYLKALKHAKDSKKSTSNQIANSYNNLAEVCIVLREYETAKKYLDSVRGLGFSNLAYRQQKYLLDYEFELAIKTDKETTRVKSFMDSLYDHQDRIFNKKLDDELFALSKAKDKERAFITEIKDAEIDNLTLKSRVLWLLILIVLLLAIGALIYQTRSLKFQKQQLQSQQRLLRSQMNPHFTFNTLYAIQKEIKNNPKNAENYLLKFSRMLRLILENSMNNYVLLEKELEVIKQYLELKLIQTPNQFSYQIVLKNIEEDEFIFIPPMLLQPIIENSVEHGFKNIEYQGEVIVTLDLKKKLLYCTIEDNGKGYAVHSGANKKSASTQLIASFIRKTTKQEIKFINKEEVHTNQSGLIVKFPIPYQLTENG
jgi:tetratricopeptide (TPR) repeat protein